MSCNVCMTAFADTAELCPRSLTCGHTFCTACVESLLQNNAVSCPTCRKATRAASVADVPKAFAVLELLGAASDAASDVNDNDAPAAPEPPTMTTDSESVQLRTHVAVVGDTLVDVVVELAAPVGSARAPVDVACVIDVSGSMGVEAKLKDENGASAKETGGLTLLDVVKHAVATVAHTLGPRDRLSVATFSSGAKLVFPLQAMSKANQAKLVTCLEMVQTEGMTNLFAGVQVGVESLAKAQPFAGDTGRRSQHVLVLTDGQPNCEPARGHVPALESLLAKHQTHATISTYGFGYSIDTPLLVSLAQHGNGGRYGFIPDASFVGTMFVNTLAHASTVVAQSAELSLELCGGAQFDADMLGAVAERDSTHAGLRVRESTNKSMTLSVGDVAADVSRHVALRVKVTPEVAKALAAASTDKGGESAALLDAPLLRATLNYQRSGVAHTREASGALSDVRNDTLVLAHRLRTEFITTLSKRDLSIADRDAVKALAARFAAHKQEHALIAALHADLVGQVDEALSRRDWFNRWGRHYVPSLVRSNALQICSNFKDNSVKAYAGPLFDKMQELGDEAFCKLPPPKPTPPPPEVLRAMARAGQRYVAPVRNVNMATFHNASAGCVHGGARIALAAPGGGSKAARDVRRGDVVRGANGAASRVECVVHTHIGERAHPLVRVGKELLLTPYHPVRVNGCWQFPIDVSDAALVEAETDVVVSFLLADRAASVLADGVEAITLAHGLRQNVAKHAFFGTERVVDCLRSLAGFERGLVHLPRDCAVRDPTTSIIVALKQ